MKTLSDIIVWAVIALFVALLVALMFISYEESKECEQRGGVMLRKASGAICAKVETV